MFISFKLFCVLTLRFLSASPHVPARRHPMAPTTNFSSFYLCGLISRITVCSSVRHFKLKWIQFVQLFWFVVFWIPKVLSCRRYVIFNSIDYSVGKDKGKKEEILGMIKILVSCWVWLLMPLPMSIHCGETKKVTLPHPQPPDKIMGPRHQHSSGRRARHQFNFFFLSHLKMSIQLINFSHSYASPSILSSYQHQHSRENESNQMQQPPRKSKVLIVFR